MDTSAPIQVGGWERRLVVRVPNLLGRREGAGKEPPTGSTPTLSK